MRLVFNRENNSVGGFLFKVAYSGAVELVLKFSVTQNDQPIVGEQSLIELRHMKLQLLYLNIYYSSTLIDHDMAYSLETDWLGLSKGNIRILQFG